MSAPSPSQQPTDLFSIYQNNTWTIRRLVDETSDPANYIEDCQILRVWVWFVPILYKGTFYMEWFLQPIVKTKLSETVVLKIKLEIYSNTHQLELVL